MVLLVKRHLVRSLGSTEVKEGTKLPDTSIFLYSHFGPDYRFNYYYIICV